MADINFPNSPVNGNTYDYAGIRYTYKQSGGDPGFWQVTTPGTYGIASVADIDAGIDDVKYITPKGLSDSGYDTAIAIFNIVRPVGSYYKSDINSPPSLGTWLKIRGIMLFAEDGTTGYVAGNTGGSKDAVNIAHNHTFTGTPLPTHEHPDVWRTNTGTSGKGYNRGNSGGVRNAPPASAGTPAGSINSVGVSGTGKNLPPFKAVYMWRRTA